MDDQEEFNLSQLYQARARDFRTRNEQQREVNRIVERVREIFRDKGEDFEEGDEKLLVAEPAEEPDFPYI